MSNAAGVGPSRQVVVDRIRDLALGVWRQGCDLLLAVDIHHIGDFDACLEQLAPDVFPMQSFDGDTSTYVFGGIGLGDAEHVELVRELFPNELVEEALTGFGGMKRALGERGMSMSSFEPAISSLE